MKQNERSKASERQNSLAQNPSKEWVGRQKGAGEQESGQMNWKYERVRDERVRYDWRVYVCGQRVEDKNG